MCSGFSLVLICIPLIINDSVHLFMCLFVIQIYTLMEYLFTSFTHFKNWVIFTIKFGEFFVYFEHMYLPVTSTFSQFVPCLFILLTASFAKQVLKSDESVDWLFPLWIILLLSCIRNLYLTQVHKDILLCFVSKLIVLSLGLWFVLS